MKNPTVWTLARRTQRMNPSVLREILKVTERPNVISFAGGLPSPSTFPVDAFAKACAEVLQTEGTGALQYAASEGYGLLREWVAAHLPWDVKPEQVLITTGSQQGLDLVAKVLIDEGSKVLVESPSYLGALQAFSAMEPALTEVAGDDEGVDPAALEAVADTARFLYVLPNFQNPTGRTMSDTRRDEVVDVARRTGLPLVEDNPYGELWFDKTPPLPLAARYPEGTIYLGSFSKVLAPGLRLGYLVAPPEVMPKLLQAKQASDLHTPSFNQRMVAKVLGSGFLPEHTNAIRDLYRRQHDAMQAALTASMKGTGLTWNRPQGGMFIWARLPAPLDAMQLLPLAVERGVAFVPGEAFFAGPTDKQALRLSFVTASVEQIALGTTILAEVIKEALAHARQREALESNEVLQT